MQAGIFKQHGLRVRRQKEQKGEKKKREKKMAYYSSCVFGRHIIGGLLPGLFEALLCLFHPERDQQWWLIQGNIKGK